MRAGFTWFSWTYSPCQSIFLYTSWFHCSFGLNRSTSGICATILYELLCWWTSDLGTFLSSCKQYKHGVTRISEVGLGVAMVYLQVVQLYYGTIIFLVFPEASILAVIVATTTYTPGSNEQVSFFPYILINLPCNFIFNFLRISYEYCISFSFPPHLQPLCVLSTSSQIHDVFVTHLLHT